MAEKKSVSETKKPVVKKDSVAQTGENKKRENAFTSWTVLFQDTWELFQSTILSYLKLFAVGVGLLVGGALLGVVLAIPLFFSSGGNVSRLFGSPTPGEVIGLFFIFFWLLSYIIIMSIYTLFVSVAYFFVLDEKKNISLRVLYNRSKPYITPFFVVNLISLVVCIGAVMVLVIPGIVVALLFTFVSNVVVLEGKRGIAALRRSYQLVMAHFWGLLLRAVAMQFIVIIITQLLDRIAGESMLLMFVSQVFSFLAEWFVIVYAFVLYRQVRTHTAATTSVNLTWIWLLAAVGWVILLVLIMVILFGVGANQIQSFANGYSS